MFKLINSNHHKSIDKILKNIKKVSVSKITTSLGKLIEHIRADIPEKKRISYGRYNIIKQMGFEFYPRLEKAEIDTFYFALKIFSNPDHDQFVRSLAVQLISIYGLKTKDLAMVLPVFKKAAADEHWEMRECSAGFIRKLIKEYPDELKKWYLRQVVSKNPLLRRFACESIRPVSDNKWLIERSDFVFSIIENLYTESNSYPRTSVGNNLSDWARIDKERVYKIVKELVKNGNKNSHWIAYRACRNLVKIEPVRVMDLLKVSEYKYKNRTYYLKDYHQI